MTIVEFLRARLDDRRARAAKMLRYAQENDVAVRDPRLLGREIPGWHEWPEVEQMAREVLAGVDAKRRIVDAYQAVGEKWREQAAARDGAALAKTTDRLIGLELAVRHLSTVHAGHPDYDEAWRP